MGSFTGKVAASWTDTFVFNLLQFHFHIASEHKINGDQYAFEMHMVHQTSADLERPYAVIGIMFEEGDENDFLKSLIEDGEVDWAGMWSGDLDDRYLDEWLYYEGGLTTPGCSQVVNWFIWPKVQEA